ncbi:MAG: site-specific DNA-methyltransferase [Candidatus Cloacimonetes bacterium]|nr:site-specific DNA-methyltransferase [Candidatus Cloacimonadota bacterium]
MELNKIKHADCLEYLKSLPSDFVDLVVTDPPYNVSQKSDIKCGNFNVTKNFGDWDYGFDPIPVLQELKRVVKPTGQIYVFCATRQIPIYMQFFEDNCYFRNLLVWNKTNPAPRISKTNFLFANEYLLYAINEKCKMTEVTFNFSKQNEMHNIFITSALQGKERLKDKNRKALHPTQKPLAILKKLIEVSSNEGDVVLDPFMGVGSTAVACKELGRNFLGCELDERYVKLANIRLIQD